VPATGRFSKTDENGGALTNCRVDMVLDYRKLVKLRSLRPKKGQSAFCAPPDLKWSSGRSDRPLLKSSERRRSVFCWDSLDMVDDQCVDCAFA
jgi:hypothetical protein